jgi:hypothetical protein
MFYRSRTTRVRGLGYKKRQACWNSVCVLVSDLVFGEHVDRAERTAVKVKMLAPRPATWLS